MLALSVSFLVYEFLKSIQFIYLFKIIKNGSSSELLGTCFSREYLTITSIKL